MTKTLASSRVALITGTSTGFGLLSSVELAKAGFRVFATMRNPEKANELQQAVRAAGVEVEVLTLDVTRDESVNAAVAEAVARAGRIDVAVNNAGYGLLGAFEDMTEEQIRRQFETNFFGVLRVCRAVLPHMRAQGGGTIINVGSIAGLMASPMMSVYGATKFALEGFTETLAIEVAPFGIRCAMVEPGPYRTDFVTRSHDMADESRTGAYIQIVQAYKEMTESYPAYGNPIAVARRIVKLAQARNPKFRNIMGVKSLAVIEHIFGREVRRRMMQEGFHLIAAPWARRLRTRK